MKRTHLYTHTVSLENLSKAWSEFKAGKRKREDVIKFERDFEKNLSLLSHDLRLKRYKHSPYSSFYIKDPKVRHIHKAKVRDRVVHHALFAALNPIFEPTFIVDSYSCRKDYGTHKGFEKLVVYCRKVSKNYTQDCWALKCDIRKFFDNINHEILFKLVKKRLNDENLLWLTKEIIESFSFKDVRARTTGVCGLPLGNLTSQLFANIYLNELDQFIKHKLKIKYYVRYADDFILLHQHKQPLLNAKVQLEEFLESNLKLELHPNKVHLRKLAWGIDFVGYVALPHHQVIRTRTKRRIFRKVEVKVRDYNTGRVNVSLLNQSIQSYLGIFKHAQAYKLQQELIRKINNDLAKKKP